MDAVRCTTARTGGERDREREAEGGGGEALQSCTAQSGRGVNG